VSPGTLSSRPPKSQESLTIPTEPVVIGKDIIELFSTAMYIDPLTLYREYVQNAVDAVDAACSAGLLENRSEGRIEIHVDPVRREARFRDNGIGVSAESAVRVLTAFGASEKRGQSARGFRGIGRLAALGFCQVLTFRTKAAGDTRSTELRWDCRRLRDLLRDPEFSGTLDEIIHRVVTVAAGPEQGAAVHYFEVHMERVMRLRGDMLLNEDTLARYLSQVAPVPFSPDFQFGAEIEEFLAEHLPTGHFDIRIGGMERGLTRPFRNHVQITATKLDSYLELQRVTIDDPDLGTVAAGWVLHHNYLGAIAAEREVRGLRARIGDIQIGGADVFAEIFPETRFVNWVVGEIHILDPRVVPNARRDAFEQSPAATALTLNLVPLARGLTQRTRDSSMRRVREKAFDASEARVGDILALLEPGLVTGTAAGALMRDLDQALEVMAKVAESDLFAAEDQAKLRSRLAELRERRHRLPAHPPGAHQLARFPGSEREAYERVFALVFECMRDSAAARTLVERLAERLNEQQ
jgi:molecular chaperone HtpG